MSLFGSLYTGAAGMNAQTRSTSVISENIANMTTTGYKRSNSVFHELVNNNRLSTSQSGSVAATQVARITQQGMVQQSGSNKDVAIVGNGFFVVRQDPNDPSGRDIYTRNGNFGVTAEGLMRNSAGFTLYGWEYDASGNVSPGALVPVDVDLLATTSRPTSFAELMLNLNSSERSYDQYHATPAQELPVSNLPSHYTRSITVYDGNGSARQLSFEFRKVLGPMAHISSATSSVLEYDDAIIDPAGSTPGIVAGDTLELNDGTNTLSISFVAAPANATLNEASTVREALNLINNYVDGGGANPFTASLSSAGNIVVQANDPTVSLDISASSATVLGASGLNFVPDPGDADYIYDPEASLTANSVAYPNQTDLPAFANTTTPNPYGWWEMTVRIPDPAAPNGTTMVELSKGLINFNGNGTMNVVEDANGQALLNFAAINFDNLDATDDITMDVNIANFTQYSGTYTVGYTDQNGAPLGTLVDTEITDDGDVLAVFSNGIKLESYRIPLATFVNADGLTRIDGTAFSESEESGVPTLLDPNTGGAGALRAAALENSNVDVAEEFSNMIVSQRAYSLNGQIINAVNEMTQTLSRLKG